MEGYDRDIPYNGDVIAPDSELVPTPNFCFANSGWQDEKGEDISLKNIVKDTDFYAAYDYVPSDLSLFKFTLNEDGESYSVTNKDIFISGKIALPDYYNDMPVTNVAAYGFKYCMAMEQIYIPHTYRVVEPCAFSASGLKDVYIEEGLKTIKTYAFSNLNNISYFEIPASVEEIQKYAVTHMFQLPMYDYFPIEKQQRMDDFKFTTAPGGNYVWDKNDKALYDSQYKTILYLSTGVTILNVRTTIEEINPCLCEQYPKLTTVNIPGNVREIGSAAFSSCRSLKDFNITGSIQYIRGAEEEYYEGIEVPRNGALFNTAIESITFPSGLKFLGIGTFFYCNRLTQVNLPDTVEYISEQAFENFTYNISGKNWQGRQSLGGLVSITMSNGGNDYYYIDQNKALIEKGTGENGGDTFLFYGMNAPSTEYSIPEGVTSLNLFSFAFNANLTTLTIPEGVIEIPGTFAQNSDNLTTVNFPISLKYITNAPGKSEDILRWGNVLKGYTWGAFLNCFKLENINFNQNSQLGIIEVNSFNGIRCQALFIPASVKEIEPFSIYSHYLTAFQVDADNQYFCNDENGVLFSKDMKILASYPMGKTAVEYEVPAGVEEIGMTAFSTCLNLNKIIMGLNMQKINMYAFIGCYNAVYDEETGEITTEYGLTEVVMNENLTTICNFAFTGCDLLTKVTFIGPVPELKLGDPFWGTDSVIFTDLENISFEVPEQYIMDYYLAWYNFDPNSVVGFKEKDLPLITYTFDTLGGVTMPSNTCMVISDMPITTKEDAYFYGWYTTDGTLNGWNEEDKVEFPYIYLDGNSVTLYARFEDNQFENGRKEIWAYILASDNYKITEIKAYDITWLTFTPEIDCRVSLNDLEMINNYWIYCFTAWEGSISLDEVWNYMVYGDDNDMFYLTANTKYYFVIKNGDKIDYTAYITIKFYDNLGEQIQMNLLAVLPSKFDLI